MKATKPSDNKRGRIVAAIEFALALAIFALALTIGVTALRAKAQNQPPILFGHAFLLVKSDSMSPEIAVDELLVVEVCDVSAARVGDNAVYTARDGALKGRQVVHKVVAVREVDGTIYLSTQGVKEGAPLEADSVSADNFIGLAVGHSLFWGKVFTFLSRAENWFFLAAVALLLPFIVKQCVKIARLRP